MILGAAGMVGAKLARSLAERGRLGAAPITTLTSGDPLTIAVSDDGLVFTKMGYLVGGRHVDYPHVLEHDGHLLIAFSGGKQSVEVLKIPVAMLP
jgi:hypothetical protein